MGGPSSPPLPSAPWQPEQRFSKVFRPAATGSCPNDANEAASSSEAAVNIFNRFLPVTVYCIVLIMVGNQRVLYGLTACLALLLTGAAPSVEERLEQDR